MEGKRYYIIYKVINLINDHIYIGQHSTNKLNDGYIGSGKLIQRAIKKYGRKNFKREILFQCKTRKEMNQKEKEIVDINFIRRKDTYNLAIGGTGGDFMTKKQRKQMGKKGNKVKTQLLKNPEWKKKYQEKLSIAVKQAKVNHNNWIGKKHKLESIERIKQTKKGTGAGKKNSQYNTKWIYNSKINKSLKISKSKLQYYLDIGWTLGRKLKPV